MNTATVLVFIYLSTIAWESERAAPSSVLVSVSVFMALSTVFHSINSPDNSLLSYSVLPGLFLPYWSFQQFHHRHHQSLNREGRWGTTDDFATSFLHFPLFSTALWDLPTSRPVHSLMLSSHLFLCPPCFLPPFTVPCTTSGLFMKVSLSPDIILCG